MSLLLKQKLTLQSSSMSPGPDSEAYMKIQVIKASRQ